jgi:hypothetical protein
MHETEVRKYDSHSRMIGFEARVEEMEAVAAEFGVELEEGEDGKGWDFGRSASS